MKPKKELRYGYTTGACATAAVRGAALMLRDQTIPEEVEIILPAGERARFRLHGQHLNATSASCFVVKDAGDDPDITNGVEIHVTIEVAFFSEHRIVIQGGTGIGRVTKPGLAVPPGEWAINPVPRRMIRLALHEVLAMRCMPATFTVTISIPDGEERAKKTLNSRLGIIGGLSILGTSGIVKPISAKAWTDTIDAALDVALACDAGAIILATGRSSELTAQKYLATGEHITPPREEAFVMMGDHAGYALRSAAKKGIQEVILAGQFAKLVKIACGHEQTHVASSELDLQTLATWPEFGDLGASMSDSLAGANTARQLLEDSGCDPALIRMVCSRARQRAAAMATGVDIKVLLAGYGGEVLYFG
jgi:cobalt-precorrin-5B (C1)-methyltransferase